ncbi:HAMP domain-containing sensor histidine kinase [Mitsuaria sp. GD03876]|uniref:sensor histidine kinase n=1 Tax=Mitsuaria sp. GD03876 TaxID=2975399 RepID=UPI00244B10BD|nr:HAMP domain-containing sensor histidine kinase [Mitsuaria sp. GD03876]MDH0864324.1 HAMP domain-containing histidine kinase [Mitsuaria sp. GD03876]
MWHPLLALMLATFVVHAFLVTGTLQLGSEAQTERRLQRIAEYWSTQPPLRAPLGLDPVTIVYPRHELMPAHLRALLKPEARGLFELGNRARDYFVLARSVDGGPAFYVVEFHSEVKPNETMEYQVFTWYLMGMVPLGLLLLWLCQRITRRVAAPMRDVGRLAAERAPDSLEPLAIPPGSSVELIALVEQVNSALQRTADVLDRERSFTQFASHELRTPAAVIQSALERLEAHARPEQVRPLARAHRGLRDMQALIDTFLRLSTDRPAAPSAPVVIDTAWVTALFHHLGGGEAPHAFTIDEQAPPRLDAPETMLHVLVANLLKNAIFHGADAPIEVSLRVDALVVRNRLPERPSAPGFGIGQLIARRICQRFGWRFTLVLSEVDAVARIELGPDASPPA